MIQMERAMIESPSQELVILADDSKFGKVGRPHALRGGEGNPDHHDP